MNFLIALPAIFAVVYRAYTHRSLTFTGCATAALTALVHSLHPSLIPFALLLTFFVLGTGATKVKHDIKATLTLSSSGNAGGEGARTSIQVLANSGCASVLCLIHMLKYGPNVTGFQVPCFGAGTTKLADLLMVGIISNYVAVAADTLSSELGILSKTKPVLITSLRTVPPGTNGGVTAAGLLSGMGGSAAIAATSMLILSFCGGNTLTGPKWDVTSKFYLFLAFTVWGTLGSVLDSLLGAVLQASVIDKRTGKIVEGEGGVKVLTHSPRNSISSDGLHKRTPSSENKGSAGGSDSKGDGSRSINSGHDILDNNQINILMAAIMTVGGMIVAGVVGI